MCGRYTNSAGPEEVSGHFAITLPSAAGTHRYNIAPSQEVLAIVAGEHGRQVLLPHWGLQPQWSLERRGGRSFAPINARMESVATKPMFKGLIAHAAGRALQIADGWYEWLKPERPGQARQPFRFSLHDGRPFAFAALWCSAERADGSTLQSIALLTCPAAPNKRAQSIHDRMPVVLAERAQQEAWLDRSVGTAEALALCGPLLPESQLLVRAASTRLNKVGAAPEGPDLLEP